MRVEHRFYCDICNRWYDKKSDCLACEARGIAEPAPIGLLKIGEPGDFYDHRLAFATAGSTEDGHSRAVHYWACRDTGAGDSLGDEMCGMGNDLDLVEFKKDWLKRPPMIRLLAWMKKNKVAPLVCVGGKIIKLSEATK